MKTLREFVGLINNEEAAIEYFISVGVVARTFTCGNCKRVMKIDIKKKCYRCSKRDCRKTRSIFKNTFFENTKKGIMECVDFCFLYVNRVSQKSIKRLLGWSSKTVCLWSKYIREAIEVSIDEVSCEIGGEGVTVEIDETKMGKRKYNRGHRVDGVWVVAGVERTPEKKIFAVMVEDRTQTTLENIISKFVKPGSIVHTDGWRAYRGACHNLDLVHKTVNHSYNFVDPESGVHTNTIEGYNNAFKSFVPVRNRTRKDVDSYLMTYIWFKQNKNDMWSAFINVLKNVNYGN